MQRERTTVDIDAELIRGVARAKADGRVRTLGQAFEQALHLWLAADPDQPIYVRGGYLGTPPTTVITTNYDDVFATAEPDERKLALAAIALLRAKDEDKIELLQSLLKKYIGKPVEPRKPKKEKGA